MSNRFTWRLASALAFVLSAWMASCARGPIGSPAQTARVAAIPKRLEAIARALADQGYSPTSWIEAEIGEANSLTLSFMAPDDARIVAVAVGAPDELLLDLHVREADTGEEIASDVSRSRRAVASFAIREGVLYELVATAVRGNGRAAIAAFRALSSAPLPRLHGLFDADEGDRLTWNAISEMLGSESYEAEGASIEFEVDETSRRSFSYSLSEGNCYTAVALGSPGVDALTLRLLHGAELVSGDFSGRYDAWVSTCPERDVEARVTVSAISGTGRARIGMFSTSRDQVAAKVGPPVRALPPPHTAEDDLRRLESQLVQRGYERGEILATLQRLDPGTPRPIALPSDLSGCYAIAAAVDGDGADIDLLLELDRSDGAGKETILPGSQSGTLPRISVCHGRGVVPSASVTSVGGAPRAVIALYELSSPMPAQGEIDTDLAYREAAARFGREGLSIPVAHIDAVPCDEGFCGSLRLQGNACYGAVVLPGVDRTARFEVAVTPIDEGGLMRRGGPSIEDFAWCTDRDADAHFSTTVAGGSGARPSFAVFAAARDKTAVPK